MTAYKDWLASIGAAIVSPANPFKDTYTVFSDGSVKEESLTKMSGFTIIEAGSIKEAISVAKKCPFLDVEGILEISELLKMQP